MRLLRVGRPTIFLHHVVGLALLDLFEEFKQESRGRSRTYEGNGLAISARLADQMDGTTRVETEKNKGSRFRVEFPRSSEPAEAGVEG